MVKELFAELDKEEDGIVYTKNLIIQLRALNEDMDKNLKVLLSNRFSKNHISIDFKNEPLL